MTTAEQLADSLLPAGKRFFTDVELSEMTDVPRKRFQEWRATKNAGPSFVKMGHFVRYPRAAVLQWLASNTTLIQN